MEIIPAILPKNFEDLREKIAHVKGTVPMVQIDLCDGVFVKAKTWPFNDVDVHSLDDILEEREGMPYWQEINFEFDLMVSDAMEKFDQYLKLGPKRIVFHLEAMGDKEEFKNFLEGVDMYVRENIEFGIAINNDTSIEDIYPFVSYVDFIQCMGIANIGKQGESFDERVLDRIKKLKEKFSNIIISVDGAVNEDSILKLRDVGVDRFVIGSAIWVSGDAIGSIEYFQSLL